MAARSQRVRLRPANPFDLIRLLARSQSDPRKAVAELVQNSLDAQAHRIDVTWFTDEGARAIRILDDGQGIFLGDAREDALRRIATTIGHSHKRSLTPAERQELLAAGKYGIGLLGFWAVGRLMEIRSRVGGGECWCLRMKEGSPDAQLARSRSRRLDDLPTFTEVAVLGVHDGVDRQIRPGRLATYLAGELRGQLLRRRVELRIHDRVARGRAQKEFAIRAQRFRGRPLREFEQLPVAGHDPARLDLYLVDEEDRVGRVVLACAGTTVLDDIAEIDGTGEPRAPWSTGRFEGVVDFADLDVAPGTRRGFAPGAAAQALRDALGALEAQLAELLEDEERRRAEERDRNLAREIRKVFRPVARRLTEYDLFDVRRGAGSGDGDPDGAALSEAPREGGDGAGADAGREGEDAVDDEGTEPALFPPGPLHSVRIEPGRSRLTPGARRRLRARPRDADGRAAAGEVEFIWELAGPGRLEPAGAHALYIAADAPAFAEARVRARQASVEVDATARIDVREDTGARDRGVGVPEPLPVHAPAEPWRSRILEGRWEYNTGHRDYLAIAGDNRARLRFLVHLFAKEVVLHNFGRPGDAETLERMVEVLTYLGTGRPRSAPTSAATLGA